MKKLGVIIACFFILSVAICYPIECPKGKKIKPCTCKPLATGLYVTCANFDDTRALVNALSNLSQYKIHNVALHNLMLKEVLPKDLFRGLDISEISVQMSNLTFSQPAFKGLDKTLQVLNIAQHSIIKSSEKYTIARLTSLTELSMKKNPLGIVKNNWLNEKIPSVEKIKLDEDEISKIESEAFSKLSRLKTISIAGNRIKDVMRSMFPNPAQNLTVIDLSDNEIKYLPEDFFSNMPALEEVLLSGNDLQSLPENTWRPIWKQLKRLLLSNNILVCDSTLSWIPKLGWPERFDAKCVAPSALVGKDLKDVYNTLT